MIILPVVGETENIFIFPEFQEILAWASWCADTTGRVDWSTFKSCVRLFKLSARGEYTLLRAIRSVIRATEFGITSGQFKGSYSYELCDTSV